jgi:hypothetical protein
MGMHNRSENGCSSWDALCAHPKGIKDNCMCMYSTYLSFKVMYSEILKSMCGNKWLPAQSFSGLQTLSSILNGLIFSLVSGHRLPQFGIFLIIKYRVS